MITNVFFATTVLFLGIGFLLLGECKFLIPYRALLLAKYGRAIALYAAALFFNLFALIYLFVRKLLLKETGRKLAHVEKQLRSGDTISEELSWRLSE
jgi:hypothetical protein